MVYIAFTHRLYAYVFEQIIKSSLHSQCKLIIPYLALIALRNSPLFSFLSSRWLTKITRPFIFTRLFVDFHFFLLIIRVHISHNLCSWCAHTRTHRVLFVLHIWPKCQQHQPNSKRESKKKKKNIATKTIHMNSSLYVHWLSIQQSFLQI